MVQVKEFLNYQNDQENQMNTWLKEMDNKIEIIDIKYSVSAFQAEPTYGWNGQEFSGALVIYKVLEEC